MRGFKGLIPSQSWIGLWIKMNINMNAWSLNGNGDNDVKSECKFKSIFSYFLKFYLMMIIMFKNQYMINAYVW